LGLHRDVQGRDRLIRDHQAGLKGRPADADALSLAPLKHGENRRMYSGATRRGGRAPPRAPRVPADSSCRDQQRFPDEVEQGHARLSEVNGSWKKSSASRDAAPAAPRGVAAELDHRPPSSA